MPMRSGEMVSVNNQSMNTIHIPSVVDADDPMEASAAAADAMVLHLQDRSSIVLEEGASASTCCHRVHHNIHVALRMKEVSPLLGSTWNKGEDESMPRVKDKSMLCFRIPHCIIHVGK